MMAPLQQSITDKSLTFPSGYRMCLLKTIVGINQPTVFTFDYLPTSKYVSLTKDKNNSFATTVSKTSQLAVREATLFEQSTYSLLRVPQWVNRDVAKQENWLKDRIGYENNDYKYWRESVFRGGGSFKIFDTKADTKAFWKINQESGEMYGIMPDGAGGGYNELKTQLDELSEVMKIYQEVISLMADSPIMSGSQIGLGITSLGIVAQFGITLVKLAASASEAIMIMDASTVLEEMDQFEKSLQLLACNVAKDVSLGVSGTAGTILGGLDKVISLMVGDNNNPFTCR